MMIKALLRGVLISLTGLNKKMVVLRERTGGTDIPRYCYSVWLRHLSMAYSNGFKSRLDSVIEIGPGDSIGVGLSSLLSGANRLYALDILEHADKQMNTEIFLALINLFRNKENIPDEKEFPRMEPRLVSYRFPSNILTDELLNETLKQDRVESIRTDIMNPKAGSSERIFYIAPWRYSEVITDNSADMIFSQAVLEYFDDLPFAYKTFYRWLKPGGFMSHVIDFSSHGTSRLWNGHWAYSDVIWRTIIKARPYALNRHHFSMHMKLIEEAGFEVVSVTKTEDRIGIRKEKLASRFKNMTDEDLTTRNAFILAVKKIETIND